MWGLVKEGFASSSPLAAAKSDAGSSEFVKAVIADFETLAGRSSIHAGANRQIKEGGFLGIGGVQVSEAEKATLGDIAKSLGTSAKLQQ